MEENPISFMYHLKSNEMKKYLEIIVQAQPKDSQVIKSIMDSMLHTFPTFLRIIKRTSTIRMTEFSILYYDLHYFLKQDLINAQRYSVKDLMKFARGFNDLYSKILKVSELNEQYTLYVYQKNSDELTSWFRKVTESLPVERS